MEQICQKRNQLCANNTTLVTANIILTANMVTQKKSAYKMSVKTKGVAKDILSIVDIVSVVGKKSISRRRCGSVSVAQTVPDRLTD